MNPDNLSTNGRVLFQLIEFDQEEQLLREIRKHPIGLFIIYATGLTIAVLLFAIFTIGGTVLDSDSLGLGIDIAQFRSIIIFIGLLLAVLSTGITLIAAYLYKHNVMLVTTEKIAQVLYRTLFDRKISQLSIGDVQDVTVTQKGVLARLFNFGTIVIETAGEQQNYRFTYTPDPYQASKAIVSAHELNLKQFGN
jgi:uncharacterized membrane protein YdbT with pleckstrin-like domain